MNIFIPLGPYAHPFYCENGMVLKKAPVLRKIYGAMLWPDAIRFGGIAKDYCENILPLPVNQRYGYVEKMEEIDTCMKV